MWGAARGVTAPRSPQPRRRLLPAPRTPARLPRGIAVIDWLLLLALVAPTRLLAPSIFERPAASGLVARGKEVIVVGAGGGQLIVKEMQRGRIGYTPIGFVDDDAWKRNDRIQGVRVLGRPPNLLHILNDNRPDELLIAIPFCVG